MKLKTKVFFVLGLLVIFAALFRFVTSHRIDRGAYYWKTPLAMTSDDTKAFTKLHIRTLYLKYFDVVWDGQRGRVSPVSALSFQTKIPDDVEIVPTVFITNEALTKNRREDAETLAEHIFDKIRRLSSSAKIGSIREIQLDCDWTTGTRDTYFALLQHFRQRLPKGVRLSATIRLHQVKYRSQTGVPPVDRGILMFYNMQYPGDPAVRNAILDLDVGESYLDHLSDYPLPLDLALPIYSWGAVFQGDQFIGLINNLSQKDLAGKPGLFAPDGSFFKVRKNTWLRGTYLYKNDRIRVDESLPMDDQRAARLIVPKIRNRDLRVVLFHWDHELVRRVGLEKIGSIYAAAR